MLLESATDLTLAFVAAAVIGLALGVFGMIVAARSKAEVKRAEEELAQADRRVEHAERRAGSILNAIPVALVETDITGKFIFANRTAHQLLGRKDSELIGLRFHSATWGITYPDGRLIPPDLLPAARALRGQTVKGFQHVVAHPGTRRRMLVSATAMPVTNEVGEVVGSTTALVEIESLANPRTDEAADPARQYFDLAGVVLMALDAEGRVREANPEALRLLGGRVDDVVGRDWFDAFVPEADREARRARFAAVLAGQVGAGDSEVSVVRALDGTERAIAWRGATLTDEEGRPAGVLISAHDVTVHRIAETPVAGEGAEPAPTAVEDQSPLIDELNRRLAAAEAALASAQSHRADLERALEEARAEQATIYETAVETATRNALAEQAAALAASEARNRRAEAALVQSQRLESVGRVTGGFAHDFSALLNVVVGALDLIRKSADSPEKVQRLADAALAAGRKGEDLTRRLLAFAARPETAPSVVDLAGVVRGLEPMLRRLAPEAVALNLDVRETGAVRVDAVQLESALVNLVANAVEACPAGGEIGVALERVEVEAGVGETLAPGLYARLTVLDNGRGMDADTAARAFEPFFTTKAEGQGSGLGLTQVQAFAREAGGDARLASEPARGTAVEILLPLAG